MITYTTKEVSTHTSDLNNNAPVLTEAQRNIPQLAWVDTFSRFLDTRFRIPGTKVRFGADFFLGLIPYAGDVVSLGLSGVMIATMARHGASGILIARMLGNAALDATIGAIPILGDLFDLVYKANIRNLQLMREHYGEGKHKGSAWPVVIAIVLIILGILILVGWIAWQIFSFVWNLIF